MKQHRDVINEFLVSCFNSILIEEEKALESITNGKLTIKDIHFIEAVFRTRETKMNTFTNIANILRITLGSLTKAFLKLENKGYFYRERDEADKRVFYIVPTKLAEIMNEKHTEWHERLMDGVIRNVPEKDMENFVDAIKNLSESFKRKNVI